MQSRSSSSTTSSKLRKKRARSRIWVKKTLLCSALVSTTQAQIRDSSALQPKIMPFFQMIPSKSLFKSNLALTQPPTAQWSIRPSITGAIGQLKIFRYTSISISFTRTRWPPLNYYHNTSLQRNWPSWCSIVSYACETRMNVCWKSTNLFSLALNSQYLPLQRHQGANSTNKSGCVCDPNLSTLATIDKTSGGIKQRKCQKVR